MHTKQKERTGNYLVKCAYCKDKWLEKENPKGVYGREHSCLKLEQLIDKKAHYFDTFILPRLSHLSKEQQDKERYYRSIVEAHSLVVGAEPVIWKQKQFGEPKACNGKCLSAKNSACECQCKGQNHGLQHLR